MKRESPVYRKRRRCVHWAVRKAHPLWIASAAVRGTSDGCALDSRGRLRAADAGARRTEKQPQFVFEGNINCPCCVDTYLTLEEEELGAQYGNSVKLTPADIGRRLILVGDVRLLPPMIVHRFVITVVIDCHRLLRSRRLHFLLVTSDVCPIVDLVVVVVIVIRSRRPRSCRRRRFCCRSSRFGRRGHLFFVPVVVHLSRN